MTNSPPDQPSKGLTLWLAIFALSLTAAVGATAALGWTNGPVVASIGVLSIGITLWLTVVREHLPAIRTRKDAVTAVVLVLVVFVGVTGTGWIFGREKPHTDRLAAPAQRTIAELHSDCGVPDVSGLIGEGALHILSTRAAAESEDRGDFVVVLVASALATSLPDSLTLVVLECTSSGWQRALSESLLVLGCDYALTTTQLRTKASEEVMVSTTCGSGAFLDFTIVGALSPTNLEVLHREESKLQGRVAQVGDHLLVTGGGVRAEMFWDGRQFRWKDKSDTLPVSEGLFVNFWWDASGGHTDLPDVYAPAGVTVHFRWDRARNSDASVGSYRLLAIPRCENGSTCAQDLSFGEAGDESLVVPHSRMTIQVQIVPNGYDWNGAVEMIIRS
jgi:hypothetical protein